MLRRSVVALGWGIVTPMRRGPGRGIASVLVFVTIISAGLVPAPSALADPVATLRDTMVSARNGTSCRPLRYNPVVEQAAQVYNRLTDEYLNYAGQRVPEGNVAPGAHVDPMPGLKDLGYRGTKASLLQGAHQSEAGAIKGALLEGLAASSFSDCAYTDFGVNMRRNDRTGYNLASVVLAAA